MKGTDLTPAQLLAAGTFLNAAAKVATPIDSDERVSLKWRDLQQLLAWYAAIRVRAVTTGVSEAEPTDDRPVLYRTPEASQ
jgi:hypothetical protein